MSIKDQIEKTLQQVVEQFQAENHMFLVDICKGKEVLVQVIHPLAIPEAKSDGTFSMAVYMTFDTSTASPFSSPKNSAEEQLARFKQHPVFHEFQSYTWRGINCFLANTGTNYQKAASITAQLLEAIAEAGPFTIDVLDNGAV